MQTGFPSIDKPWLKYYPKEAVSASLPECTMYEYIYNRNQDNLNRVAMNYYGANTTYGQMFHQIDRMAGTLEVVGVQCTLRMAFSVPAFDRQGHSFS